MILEHYSVAPKNSQEAINCLTQRFRKSVEIIKRVRAVFKRFCFLLLSVLGIHTGIWSHWFDKDEGKFTQVPIIKV
jgi:hypothetical protein